MKKTTIRLLCLILLLTVLPLAARAEETGTVSNNRNGQNYAVWADTVDSYLAEEAGGYLRVEYVNGILLVEHYDSTLRFQSRREITLPLPIFGGVYICDDYNFVVCGQTNWEEDDNKEVFRVIRYSKDWVEQDHASLYGANTTVPFDAGSLRFARNGNMLYVRTAHEMYTADDGLNHQANVSMAVRISDMTMIDAVYLVIGSRGYCSHSFNQFFLMDGNKLVAVDHGDAYPRSIVLNVYTNSASSDSFQFRGVTGINLINIPGGIGDNGTGVSVGGLECSSTHYLVAGNTTDLSKGANYSGRRNIFVTATPKNNPSQASTVQRMLTDYPEDAGISCSTPHLVKISQDKFFIAWNEGSTLRYCFLDGQGNVTTQVYSTDAYLSDCVPIVSGDHILWYETNRTAPVFYRISLTDPASVEMIHVHVYSLSLVRTPTLEETGAAGAYCSICQETVEITLPTLDSEEYKVEELYKPTCYYSGTNRYSWTHEVYGTVSFQVSQEPLGCEYGDWIVSSEAGCWYSGTRYAECIRCGRTKSEWIEPLGHDYVRRVCTRCGEIDGNYRSPVDGITRIYGATRYETAFKTANELKSYLGVDRFQCIVVACGTNFPDALAGTYLAAQNNAPIILTNGKNVREMNAYIRENLGQGGTLYLLGDAGVVPNAIGQGIEGITVKRLGGATRYDTNLLILQEAGVENQDIIVCTGLNFADSLSASALGMPILLVKDGLYPAQKEFLSQVTGDIYIIGGTGAVNATVEKQLAAYGTVKRIGGVNRYETSVLVAREFFRVPSDAVLAYAQNFPDGLCGGPLAYYLNAPMILTATGKENAAVQYAWGTSISEGYVLGGTGLISDGVVRSFFDMVPWNEIQVK